MAPSRSDRQWLDGSDRLPTPSRPAGPGLRERLSAHYLQVALMEHASVAAFARFTLQLLALGAPAELVEAATQAQAAEARHARIGFHLASHYGKTHFGPGRLELSGALDALDPQTILLTTFREGCLGETRAALEVAEAAERTTDRELSLCLSRIAEDEARHAELAFRTVAWLVREFPELREVLAHEIDRALVESVALPKAQRKEADDRTEAAAHGVLDEQTLAVCRARAFWEVIVPCAERLVGRPATAVPNSAVGEDTRVA